MLIIVRHGRTPANAAGELLGRRDVGLDDEGRRQAAAISEALPSVQRVVASPLLRTRETAACFGLPVEVDERLIELDYGELEGIPVGEVPPQTWEAWRADTAWSPPGGESLERLFRRVLPALEDLSDAASSEDVAVVTHVSPIKAAIAWAMGAPVAAQWRCFVAQASISRISTSGPVPVLHSFNEIGHLSPV